MKNSKFNSGKASTKKWFYLTIAFGVVFAIITTAVAIFRNINSTKTRKIQDQGFIETRENLENIPKNMQINTQTPAYDKLDTNFSSDDEGKNNEEEEKEKDYIQPVSGEIINDFSNDELVLWKQTNEYKTHNGIDIAAKQNTPVKAIYDGVVKDISSDDELWGTCIIIEHKNNANSKPLYSIYKGLSGQVSVKVGQQIKKGTVLGTIGKENTIKVEEDKEPHLHFEMQEDGIFVDPKNFLNY